MAKPTLTDKDLELIRQLIVVEIQNNNDTLERKLGVKQNKIITMLQQVMGELKTVREEQIVQSYQLNKHQDSIDVLERRPIL